MRVGEIRRQRDQIVIAGQRLVVALQRVKDDAEGKPGRGRRWIELQTVPQQPFRRCRVAELVLGYAEHMQRVEMIGMFLQDFDVTRLRLGQVPGAVERARLGEQLGGVVTILGDGTGVQRQLLIHPAVTSRRVVARNSAQLTARRSRASPTLGENR
jgi:hypothetical protein